MIDNKQAPIKVVAIASLVLVIIVLFSCSGVLILGPIAIIIGVVALKQIRHSDPNHRGYALTIAGIGIGVIGLIFTASLFFENQRPHGGLRTESCLSNIKQISLSLLLYTADYDDKLPPFDNWNDFAGERRALFCPSAENRDLPSYALNSKLGGVSLNDIKTPDKFELLFDSVPGKNRVGGLELLPSKPRHKGGDDIGYVDGHVKWCRRSER